MRERTRHWLTASVVATLGLGAFWLAHAGEPKAEAAQAAAPQANKLPVEQTCIDCHGKGGRDPEPGLPVIGGQSADYLADAMAEYRGETRPCPEAVSSGDPSRPSTNMCNIAKELSEKDIAKLSEELASAPFARAKKCTNPEKVAAGRKLHEMYCRRCHDSASASDSTAMLEGQSPEYLDSALKKIEEGERKIPAKMRKKLEELSPEHRKALLEYYASFR